MKLIERIKERGKETLTQNCKRLASVALMAFFLSACNDSTPPESKDGEQDSSASIAQFTCAMHPHYIASDPDGSCPICGMDLVPLKKRPVEKASAAKTGAVLRTEVVVAPTMLQTMGVRTSPAEVIEFGRTLRAFGTVEADERLENVSVSRFEGWIENLNVRAEGDAVRNGDLLYRVYSPDLIAAQRDYIGALTTGNNKRIESVKQRLLSIGMQKKALQQLAQRKTVINKVPVFAETDGIVAELNVRDGGYIKPGTPILRLQSYGKVWVIASIPETDLPLIDRGIAAGLRFPSAPSAPSNGNVDYIYPTIDPKTRTGRVRIKVDNSSGDLLPGAYADISLSFAKQARLSIASEAILRDSRGDHVILALGQGRFDTRSVTTGVNTQGRTEILAGLQAGDLVVTSGQFMLDSEVNLREGLAKLSASLPSSAAASSASMDTNQDTGMLSNKPLTALSELDPDPTSLAQIDHFVDMALYFQNALVNGESIDPSFVDPAIALSDILVRRYTDTELLPILQASKEALVAAQVSLENGALAADLEGLMKALKPWLLEGVPQHYADLGLTLYLEQNTGRFWLQKGGPMANPYGDDKAQVWAWPAPAHDADTSNH